MFSNDDPKYIHEGALATIVKAIKDNAIETLSVFKTKSELKNNRSIARASRDLILTFPVIVSDKTSVETASMIAKAVETKAVTMLQLLFAAIQTSNANDAFSYLKKFHTNMEVEKDGPDDYSPDFFYKNEDTEDNIIDKELFNEAVESFKKFGQEFYLEEHYADHSLNTYVIKPSAVGCKVLLNKILEDNYDDNEKSPTVLDKQSFVTKQLDVNNEIKKANELMPTMVTIKFVAPHTRKETLAVIGVKARLQYVSSEDMINRIIAKNDDNSGLFGFIKATTGQISFWKDFVFALDKAKLDTKSTSTGVSNPIWKLLEKRAIKSKFKRWTNSINDASAITTMIISKEEVDMLKKEERISLDKASNINKIMEAYNLMCVVIVDETLEKALFLYDDGSKDFEAISFTKLQRDENSSYKKVINLLAKAR